MENTRQTPLPEKELWDVDDLRAAGCGSRTTVWRLLRDDPSFPRPIRLRGLLRWAPEEIRAWIRQAPRKVCRYPLSECCECREIEQLQDEARRLTAEALEK